MGRYLAAIHGGATPKARETLRQELGIDAMLADLTPLIDGTREGAERIADIVKNLRRFSFSNAGGQAPFDLAEVARTAAHWAARGRKRAVPVDLHLPEQGLTLHGHAGSIHQVMVNLVQNALDAVEETEKPRIGIALRQEGKHAVVMVTDNGPGIPSEYLLKVFDPFFTSKPVGHGTGLGLWISYTIIKDHGGAIEAGNRPEGGAALIFTLPI
jgi:two-component system sensor histidine kinase HupT/HoxJ